jgi:hypothetical protein
MESCWRADEEISQPASRPGHRRSLRRCQSAEDPGLVSGPEGRPLPHRSGSRPQTSCWSRRLPRQAFASATGRIACPVPPRAALRSALDFRIDGFIAAAGDDVHEPGLSFRFPSLSLKPPSKGRYDYIALVPLDFRRPERHARKSTPKLSRHFASRTSTSRSSTPRSTDEFRRLGRSTRTYAIEPPTGDPP